ncbi:DNA invertase Pin-like site-specific DNA recombinase [Mucilaginibacter gracilis]|uniref:DNA invertase Pin-like site-specific DNA recombinase n=1 Tax=Mucilaginibacter gracilis TaxID=423350 RepID=A0A495IVH7_9SPHI|nr:recombinase family protein [Mucilaginibacter gracilis]RKR80014.1 DNA invertase Pin-like site-specific DNA recombinase [Mucilaginibacter gracilis]
MKIAHLYIRVSTDEQADKGYSQRNQDEMLRKYCQLQSIAVREVIYEDHSAKSFNRPAWQTMLGRLKRQKTSRPDYILFTKWDRFSRNAGDAYQMISLLRGFNIEPQAIEQPLDLSIPENKMMLAFYLAAPEVENDRRALNIFHGLRRAKKEGRWVSSAPVGYINKSHEDGRKYIAVNELQAEIMRWAFTELATGKYPVEQVWKFAKQKGITCGRNNFWNLIRNPVYCGRIVIPAFKDEAVQYAKGQHAPIISEDLFDKVQRVLNKRARPVIQKTVPGRLHLRGFLKCPKCNRMLTGSPSKGNLYYYYYYHCSSACGVRFKAEQVNETFIALLKKHSATEGLISLFKKAVRELIVNNSALQFNQQRIAAKQLEEQQQRVERAKELLIAGYLEGDDYRTIKATAEEKIAALQKVLADVIDPMSILEQRFKNMGKAIGNLAFFYQIASVEHKRKMVGLLFPGNLTYADNGFETVELGNWTRLVFD